MQNHGIKGTRIMTLKGKTAVITGSNSGIGLGVARELARAGADVVLNSFTDRDEDHALARALGEEFGVTARYIKADMSKGAECRALIEQATAPGAARSATEPAGQSAY